MLQTHEGGCQCGAVRFRITGEATALFACHCTICQTHTGTAFSMAAGTGPGLPFDPGHVEKLPKARERSDIDLFVLP